MTTQTTQSVSMTQRVSLISLGVRDFAASLRFYKDGLGWQTDATEKDPIAFFQMNGLIFGICSRAMLAEDIGIAKDGHGFSGITLAQNVDSPEMVDAVLQTAEAAGARIVKKGQPVFWGGYSGYFADPDNHLWEIAHNPFWQLDADGTVHLQKEQQCG